MGKATCAGQRQRLQKLAQFILRKLKNNTTLSAAACCGPFPWKARLGNDANADNDFVRARRRGSPFSPLVATGKHSWEPKLGKNTILVGAPPLKGLGLPFTFEGAANGPAGPVRCAGIQHILSTAFVADSSKSSNTNVLTRASWLLASPGGTFWFYHKL